MSSDDESIAAPPPPAPVDCSSVESSTQESNRARPEPVTSPMSSLPVKKKPRSINDVVDEIEQDSFEDKDNEEEKEEEASEEEVPPTSSFRTWLCLQRSMGVPLEQVLGRLGLSYSAPDGASNEEDTLQHQDQLWDMLIQMGERLLASQAVRPRIKLQHINTLEDIVGLLENASKVIVLTGAGISVSCGIPDFRSENGIYSRLQEYDLPSPESMFDIEYFRQNPKPFFAFAKELFPKSKGYSYIPSRSHRFLKLLEARGKLLRIYSQNIDMLEYAAGVSEDLCVLCHGSFATATCLKCKVSVPGGDIRSEIAAQQVPVCKTCNEGVVKPDIVFFGEQLPNRFHRLIENDVKEADLVFVMGSSLNVNPVQGIVNRIPAEVPSILINREVAGRPNKFDVELLGYSDDILDHICNRLQWDMPDLPRELFDQELLRDFVDKSPDASVQYAFHPPSRYCFPGAIIPSERQEDSESDTGSSGEDDQETKEEKDAAEKVISSQVEQVDVCSEIEK